MTCKACNNVLNSPDGEDCFEKALDVLKQHYTFTKNALLQRDLELKQIKERNDKLNKALLLLQKNHEQQQQQPAKRFKFQHSGDALLAPKSSQEDYPNSDFSLTDDERLGANNLNMALNSEQLFDTSGFSQTKNNVNLTTSSSELVPSPRVNESPKRNKQRDAMRCLKDRNNKTLERSKSEWQSKGRGNSPIENSWAAKILQLDKPKTSLKKGLGSEMKKSTEKKLCLSLKKTNPSKVKQSLLHFNKSKDDCSRESDLGEDIIDASPVIAGKNTKAGRSWAQRSGHNHSSNITSNHSISALTIPANKKADPDKTLDDIVFDFSPSKKSDLTLDLKTPQKIQPKQLKYDNDISTDCTSLPNNQLELSPNKIDTSSVVILTPGTQDIIFVDDSCNYESDIDTMELLADMQASTDNLEKLKKYESKNIQKQQQAKELDEFKKPDKPSTNNNSKPLMEIKREKITQDLQNKTNLILTKKEDKPSCSSSNNLTKTKAQNPLLSSDELDTDDEDFMPKPFIVKQEPPYVANASKKLSIKQRFNIECEDCEKLISVLGSALTDAQIQQHLDKCKNHNNPDIMRQNTPQDFWNPFILSFQADDPRNEVLIDNRFKHDKNK